MCEHTIDGLTSLVDLLAIANKYQVQGLKDFCADKLVPEICNETVAELWAASEMFQCFRLKIAVHSFLCKSGAFKDLNKVPGLENVVKSRPEYMCDLLTFVSMRKL